MDDKIGKREARGYNTSKRVILYVFVLFRSTLFSYGVVV